MLAPAYILVVEDDFDIRDALTQILEEEGYAVRSAANGREALDAAGNGVTPSLILLDLMMPVMNGWQFRAEQLRDARLASVPVLVISADPHLRDKIGTLGDVGVLKKPIHLDELLSAVASRCQR
jgi:DNA-binding response OmpR family regulator